MIRGVSTCYFLSNSANGYKVGSDCYSVFSGKISHPFLRAHSSLYNTFFLPSSPAYTCRPDPSFVGLCHINLPPKLLGSSCESEKSLLRHHFHINSLRLLVVEHLMWSQQLFLELLYRHAPGCSFIVLVFEVLWKAIFDGKSLFFHLGLGWLRTGLSSAAS